MHRQMRNTRGHVNRTDELVPTIPSIPLPPSNRQQLGNSNASLSPIMEVTIVGGLTVFILLAPNVASFVKQKFHQIKTQMILWKTQVGNMGNAKLAQKLELLSRRRKNGSLIRVIGTILPGRMFNPPCRIYIPNWAMLSNNLQGFPPPLTNLSAYDITKKVDLPSENDVGDGLIEAFEVASEVFSVSDDEVEEDASSNPEGWTQGQRKFMANFNPTIMNVTDSSFARCSTPKANVETLHFNASFITNQHGSKLYENQTEVMELKKMVEGLMSQINCLNQSLLTTQNQLATQQIQISSQVQSSSHTIPVASASLPVATVSVPPGPPPPPPPPPPPMPPMPSFEKKPLIITKKGNQDKLIEKKPQISLSDVLKELPNAKLRRIERSPGGTPLKPQLKLAKEEIPLDIGNQLAFALRKRYESMHSPVCETDTDKENMEGTDDSFEDSPVSAKRNLFPIHCSPRRGSGGSQKRNLSPFGQHLLKKRNLQLNEGVSPSSPSASALREHNQ